MKSIKNYYKTKYKSLLISKIITNNVSCLPKIKKLVFFFIIDIKQYKKNTFLFYIVINVLFGGINFLKKKIKNNLMLIELFSKKELYDYIYRFVNFYLPLLGSNENNIKQSIFKYAFHKENNIQVYRVNYFSFPVIPELDNIYEQQEMVYTIVSNYRLQLDIYIQVYNSKKDGLCLTRMYRLPTNVKIKY